VGPFRDAYLGLGCRLGLMPAVVIAASITDNAKVLAAGIAERGFPNSSGKIALEIDRTHAHATIGDDRDQLLEVTLPSLQTMEPGRLAFDHADGIITREDGALDLVATPAEMAIQRAALCKDARIEYPVDRKGIWQVLNCRHIVSAQAVSGERTFSPGQKPQ